MIKRVLYGVGVVILLLLGAAAVSVYLHGTKSGVLEKEAIWLSRYYGLDKNAPLAEMCRQIQSSEGVTVRADEWQDRRASAKSLQDIVFISLPTSSGKRLTIMGDQRLEWQEAGRP